MDLPTPDQIPDLRRQRALELMVDFLRDSTASTTGSRLALRYDDDGIFLMFSAGSVLLRRIDLDELLDMLRTSRWFVEEVSSTSVDDDPPPPPLTPSGWMSTASRGIVIVHPHLSIRRAI